MAEFSKQYIENFNMDWGYDFDIIEEFNKLKDNTYIPMICEGYGFVGIGKLNNSSEPSLLFDYEQALKLNYLDLDYIHPDPDQLVWVKFSKLNKKNK